MNRTYHPWWQWECYHAGLFKTQPPPGMTKEQALETYREFLADLRRFEHGIKKLFYTWPRSCDQFLSNPQRNRVAWIGQASLCIATGIPAVFRGGYKRLDEEQQKAADGLAQAWLEKWSVFKCH